MSISSVKTGEVGTSLLVGNTFYDPSATWFIERITPSNGTASITFSNIPQIYKHLQIRGISRDTYSANAYNQELGIRFNSDTGSNYSLHRSSGNGTGTSTIVYGEASTTQISTYYSGCADAATASVYGSNIFDIYDYSSTSKFKTLKYFCGVDTNVSSNEFGVTLGSGLWRSTSGITSVQIRSLYTAFKSGTTFALYGIKG